MKLIKEWIDVLLLCEYTTNTDWLTYAENQRKVHILSIGQNV